MRCSLKICIGLSVLVSSFVQAVFGKPPSLQTAATPPHTPSSSSRQGNRGTRSQWVFFPFFSGLQLACQWAHLSSEECAQIYHSYRDQSAEDRSVYPTICQAGGAHFCSVALSPSVTWLRFLHEHFFIIT